MGAEAGDIYITYTMYIYIYMHMIGAYICANFSDISFSNKRLFSDLFKNI